MKTGVCIGIALAVAAGSAYGAQADSLVLVASDAAFISGAQAALAATKQFS